MMSGSMLTGLCAKTQFISALKNLYEKSVLLEVFNLLETQLISSSIAAVTRRSAVLVALVPDWELLENAKSTGHHDAASSFENTRVWLTRRAANLRQGGDICLPGGVQENAESLIATALREAEEEIGIKFSQLEVLGPLPSLTVDRSDRSGNLFMSITPVVAVVTDPHFVPVPSPDEVATVFTLPLKRFLSSDGHATRNWTTSLPDGKELPMVEQCFTDDLCDQYCGEKSVTTWGVTARALIATALWLYQEIPHFSFEGISDVDRQFDYFREWLEYAIQKYDSKHGHVTVNYSVANTSKL